MFYQRFFHILVCLLAIAACDTENTDTTRSSGDPCAMFGDTVTLDANIYGVNVGPGFEACDGVTISVSDKLVLVSLDGEAYLVGREVLAPNAAGEIVIDSLQYDGVLVTPFAQETIPCDPSIQCCAPKQKKVWVTTGIPPGDL